jgi:hypothetical protein
MPVLAGKWRNSSIAASNPPADPPIPAIGQLTIFASALVRGFLPDEGFLLAVLFGGMALISINRSKSRHKVEYVFRKWRMRYRKGMNK